MDIENKTIIMSKYFLVGLNFSQLFLASERTLGAKKNDAAAIIKIIKKSYVLNLKNSLTEVISVAFMPLVFASRKNNFSTKLVAQ